MQQRARDRLSAIFPPLRPWTTVALWHGLSPAVAPVPTGPLADEIDDICRQRLSGLLLRYLRDTETSIDPTLRARLQQVTLNWTARGFRAGQIATGVLDLLSKMHVGVAVSKGPGIARLYPSADCRPYSDIDLLVEPTAFAAVVDALQLRGWNEEDRNQQPWPYFRKQCREGLNLQADAGGSVDVHHRVPPWIWSEGLDQDAMIRRSEEVDFAGARFPCLADADNLLVVALHLVSDRNEPGKSLIVWRDLVQLARAVPLGDAVNTARSMGLAGWLKCVLAALPDPMGTGDLRDALPDDPIPHPRRLQYLLSPRTGDLGVMASQFLRLPLPNGLAFAAGMVVPSREFLRTSYPTHHRLYRRWWSNTFDHLHGSGGRQRAGAIDARAD